MELSAEDRTIIKNLTEQICGLKESLNWLQNSSLTPRKIDSFITAINSLGESIEKLSGKVMNLDPER